MPEIKVTCDSTCDLTPELYHQYQIEMIPLGVSLGDDFRYDNINVTAQELYDYADRTGQLPKTSAIPVGEYQEKFQKYVEMGCQVIHINLSSDLSSSYQNACIAARNVGNVSVVDSKNLSTGSGYLALSAVEMARQGMDGPAIAEKLNQMKKHLDVSFVLQTLEYLHKGGRCSGVAAFGANLLKIRPEIEVADGKMHVARKYRGNIEKSILSYIRGRLEGETNLSYQRIFVTHSGVPEEIVRKAIDLVKELQPFQEIIETTAGSTISSHCGPNCLGILFLRDHEE